MTLLFTLIGLWTLIVPAVAQGEAPQPRHVVVDIVSIKGEEFVVTENGTEGVIHVGTDTQQFGHFQPGDRIEVWVYPNGHAKTIMILRSGAVIQQDLEQQKQSEIGHKADALSDH